MSGHQWKRVKLNDLLDLNESGTWGEEGDASDYPVLRSSNIHDGRLVLNDIVYRTVSVSDAERYRLEEGDIIVTKSSGSPHLIGKCCLFTNPDGRTYLFSNFTQRLRARKDVLNSRFLFFFLESPIAKNYLKRISNTTSGLRNLSMKEYSSQLIPLPPLPIQKQIAAILEKADAAREKRRKANELTEQFLQSTFLEMFGDPVTNPKGWKMTKFAKIAVIERESVISAMINPNSIYIGLEHIEKDTGRLIGYEVANVADLRSNKFSFTQDHILYGKLRPYLNKVCLPQISGVCSTDILPIKPIHKVSEKYFLAYLMKQSSFVKRATTLSTGANLPRISPNALYAFDTFLPPIEVQKKFASLVEKVESLRVKQRKSEQELDNLFNSLMQKAFKGEIVLSQTKNIEVRQRKRMTATDLHAGILGKIILAHEDHPEFLPTLGHVKGEKICHIIENVLNEDFGREPFRLAAGPADFKHLLRVEHRAQKTKWFFTKKRNDKGGTEYRSGKNMQFLLGKLANELDVKEVNEIDRIIALFVPMNTEHAEVVVTVYAAWNDLLLEGRKPTDEEIVLDARENWAKEKLEIERGKFFKSIKWLEKHQLVPLGRGKHTKR